MSARVCWKYIKGMYVLTNTHTYMHTYVQTNIHMYGYTYVHAYKHTYVRTYIRTCIQTYVQTHVHTYMCSTSKYITDLKHVHNIHSAHTSRVHTDVRTVTAVATAVNMITCNLPIIHFIHQTMQRLLATAPQ